MEYMKKNTTIKYKNCLAEILEKKNITGYKLANDLRIRNQVVYSVWMREDNFPNVKTALKLADYLGVTLNDLFVKIDK